LFSFQDDQLYFKSKMPLVEMGMMEKSQEELESNAWIEAKQRTIYQAGNIVFVIKSFMPKAKKDLAPISSGMGESGMKASNKNAIVFNVSDDNVTRKVHLLTAENQVSEPVSCKLGDVEVTLSYGMLTRKMPFSITLRKFEIERYPGSDSPSSYASEISVSDPEQKAEIPFRIFMNNILKYKGYRFFQTSYDEDEQGTILSVSHDYWGTFVSYTGYLLLLLGMTWTLFNKNSRFSKLLNMISEVQKERKSGKNLLLVLVLVFASYQAVAQNLTKNDHLATLNSLLVQDKAQGRIEPFGTLASDLLRKIYKKSNYNGKKPVEVIISMSTRPSDWLNERMIKVANPELAKELGAVNGYISYNQAYDFENNSAYRLKDKVEQVYHKPQSDQNSYDKEILNVDERINICYGIFNGEMPAFVPQAGNNKWLALSDLHNENEFEPAENQPESMLLVANYYKAVSEALVSGEWKNAQNSLTKLKEHQTRTGGQAIPSPTKVRLEILY
ncbi:MAG TPA: cytochrome c biogenesis protein ResB, partial [Paludibacter sp.]|nr:cytochrome c biogenesis protein ResB [Paludibacter sp.]